MPQFQAQDSACCAAEPAQRLADRPRRTGQTTAVPGALSRQHAEKQSCRRQRVKKQRQSVPLLASFAGETRLRSTSPKRKNRYLCRPGRQGLPRGAEKHQRRDLHGRSVGLTHLFVGLMARLASELLLCTLCADSLDLDLRGRDRAKKHESEARKPVPLSTSSSRVAALS